ncbi:MAG TPA: isoprenylcysteine carboxylmethyltransferase family protein [Candidatus Dormibacteraeota bacterium]|nr:isoprenylcysteine carboxylmethyltransferase family protein [Candidatus Dormibacteraeota bacterium]
MSPVFRTLIVTMVVPGFWTVAIPYWLLPRGARPDVRGVDAAGWLLIAAGIALYSACAFWGFALRGKGTPLPIDPPKKLVVEGPYTIVRNPMYWSVVFVMLGEAAVFHSRALVELAIAFFVGANLFVRLYEEPGLKRKFGAEYEEYSRCVPRWLPRFKPFA